MHDMLTLIHGSLDPLLAQVSILALWGSVWPYLAMLLGFSVIVFVHELGHFGAAKWAGVRVERFAIGFGRELLGFTKGETRYSFNILPLGGYVKMLGQEDFDDKSEELRFKDDPRSFINKPVGQRMIIVSAGVVMNILFACLLFMIVFLIGMETIDTRIAHVEPDSPAERAGLLPGDRIKHINNYRILEFSEISTAVMLAGLHEPLHFEIERNGELRNFSLMPELLTPADGRDMQRLVIGITNGVTRVVQWVGPEMNAHNPNHPHVGDVLVSIDGRAITDENVNQLIYTLAYAQGTIMVERPDPAHPDTPSQRVRVDIPPRLKLFPSNDKEHAVSILGLAPLVRFSEVVPRGRAYLAGLEVGDTLVSFNDTPFPTREQIARAIQLSPERDIAFQARKRDGRMRGGFVRPRTNKRGWGTIGLVFKPISGEQGAEAAPQASVLEIFPLSVADRAGIERGDVILSCDGFRRPSARQVASTVRSHAGKTIKLEIRKADGSTVTTAIVPERSGSIEATLNLVAYDLLRVSDVIPTLQGRPSPAAQSGIERGSLITAINTQPVKQWRELIDAFRANAGTSVTMAYVDPQGRPRTCVFPVPHSIRTRIGAKLESRIVSIDGDRTVMIKMPLGQEEVTIGYRKGTHAKLRALIGRKQVPVEYRNDPLSEIETAYIDVTEDMIDPWLGRIAFSASIATGQEMTLLKGKNALDALSIGVHKTYYFILQVYKTMERMIFTRSMGVEALSGPLGIIDIGGKIARKGTAKFLFFLAIISANLAVINFLPLPIVDGGLMVFLLIEKIKGSPISLRVQIATQMVGIFLLIGAFILITLQDAMRMFG